MRERREEDFVWERNNGMVCVGEGWKSVYGRGVMDVDGKEGDGRCVWKRSDGTLIWISLKSKLRCNFFVRLSSLGQLHDSVIYNLD